MSFVSVYAMENFVNVVSDGQVTDPTGKITNKNYKKFVKIGQQQFLAFAGNQGLAEQAVKIVPFKNEGYPLSVLAQDLHKQVLTIPVDDASILLAVGGLNVKNEIEVISFSNRSDQKNYFNPKGDEIAYTFLTNTKNNISDEISETKLKQFLSETGYNTSSKAFRAQKKLNDFISDNDSTVNKVTFELNIKKR